LFCPQRHRWRPSAPVPADPSPFPSTRIARKPAHLRVGDVLKHGPYVFNVADNYVAALSRLLRRLGPHAPLYRPRWGSLDRRRRIKSFGTAVVRRRNHWCELWLAWTRVLPVRSRFWPATNTITKHRAGEDPDQASLQSCICFPWRSKLNVIYDWISCLFARVSGVAGRLRCSRLAQFPPELPIRRDSPSPAYFTYFANSLRCKPAP